MNAFVVFVADQLTRLESSSFFWPDNLEASMSKSFTSKSPKAQARELHFDIVNNLFELAKRITIVEKFQQEAGLQ